MSERVPHRRALPNYERAVINEAKVRYALRDRDKRRAFQALGYSEERGNRRALRDVSFESLPLYPAPVSHEDRWGLTCNVDMPIWGRKAKPLLFARNGYSGFRRAKISRAWLPST